MNSDSTPFGQLCAHQANLQSADRRSLRCGEAARIQNIEPPSISSMLHSTSKWSSPLLLCEPVDFHPAFSKQGFTTACSRSFSRTYKLSAGPLSLKNRLIFSHNLLYSWPQLPEVSNLPYTAQKAPNPHFRLQSVPQDKKYFCTLS